MKQRIGILIVLLAGALLLSAPAASRATLYSIDKDPNRVLYGNLDQDDIPGIGANACGPAAAVNSFVYLENRYPGYFDRSLIPDTNQNGQRDYNELVAVGSTLAGAGYMNTKAQTGTWDDMFIYGKYAYLEQMIPGKTVYAAQLASTWGWIGTRPADERPPIPKPAWVQQNTVPTWQFLYNQLVSCEDVEILINWYDGGHYLTVSSFHWNDVNENGIIEMTEGATIDYIDPQTGAWGVSPLWHSAGAGSSLEVGYGNTGGANINLIVSESIPEPISLTLMVLGIVAMLHRRRS